MCLVAENKKHNYPLVHRLVLETFVGPCPEGMECRHRDGNKENNFLENLLWGTKLENARDKHKHGTTARGEKNGMSVLSNEDIVDIRQCRKLGLSLNVIARIFDVSKKTILNIIQGKIWRYVG